VTSLPNTELASSLVSILAYRQLGTQGNSSRHHDAQLKHTEQQIAQIEYSQYSVRETRKRAAERYSSTNRVESHDVTGARGDRPQVRGRNKGAGGSKFVPTRRSGLEAGLQRVTPLVLQ